MKFDEFHSRNVVDDAVENVITERIIGAAIEVHKQLGPGLPELMYEKAICREFELRGIRYQRQCPVLLEYKGAEIGEIRVKPTMASSIRAASSASRARGPWTSPGSQASGFG